MHNTSLTLGRELFDELYGIQPQAITWLVPVWSNDGQTITDFEFTYSNTEAARYFNRSPEELNGLRLSTTPTLTAPLRQTVLEEMRRVYQTGASSRTNMYNPALNKYARILRTKLRNGILSVVQDITEENRIISELEEKARLIEAQKSLLDNILKNSSNGISVSRVFRDQQGTVIDAQTILANDAAVRYTGFPREIYLTKRATEIEPAVLTSPYYQACINTLATGEPFVTQYRMEATARWLELTVSRLDSDHLIQIFTDITPIKEAQLQLEQSVEDLRRSNASLEEFNRAVSHDLKEPIRKVQFFAERLRTALNGRLTQAEEGLLERVENASQRMHLLIDDLLSYAQLNSSGQEQERVDLNEKIETICNDLELLIEEKKAVIERGPLPTVRGYRRQLQQLFQNLLTNALKYSKLGVPPLIRISAREVSGAASGLVVSPADSHKPFYLIEVTDNGIGFEQQFADKIFNVFTRLHGKQEYSGTGVGLAIVKRVVENHQGYIEAKGLLGTGATFRILLPV